MHVYTNVVFDRAERDILKTAGLHLGVAYPDVHSSMPRKHKDRLPDHEARVLFQLVRDTGQGTHENVNRALAVVEHLAEVLVRESSLDHWLGIAERDSGTRPPYSEEPTSHYQQLRMLSEIRADQLPSVLRARDLLQRAAPLTSPQMTADREDGAYDYEPTGV